MSLEDPAWLRRLQKGSAPLPAGSPRAGQVFHILTDLLPRRDAHPDGYRPAVVMAVNHDQAVNRAFVITRTTSPDAGGVAHEAVDGTVLDKDAKFDPEWLQGVDLMHFKAPFVEYVLDLSDQAPEVWAEVRRQYEELA